MTRTILEGGDILTYGEKEALDKKVENHCAKGKDIPTRGNKVQVGVVTSTVYKK